MQSITHSVAKKWFLKTPSIKAKTCSAGGTRDKSSGSGVMGWSSSSKISVTFGLSWVCFVGEIW